MAYSKQTWDTTSYVNPTRMNHIEQGIYDVDNKIQKTQVSVERNATVSMELSSVPYGGILIISRGTNGIYALSNVGATALVSASGVTVSMPDTTHISISNSTNTIVATAIY